MCTLSWFVGPSGYLLFFNRDERRSRQFAEPPRIERAGGLHFAAPRDGDAGGTWIFVNEAGVTACLLNLFRYRPHSPDHPPISRGVLVLGLAGFSTVDGAERSLIRADLSRYAPFTLALFGRGAAPRALRWDGATVTRFPLDDDALPLTSSGFDPEGVARSRRGTLARIAAQHGGLTGSALVEFHRSHHPDRGPYSPCMHGEVAHTVSLTTVADFGTGSLISYQPGAPCEDQPTFTARL